jgi:hypothetical protein
VRQGNIRPCSWFVDAARKVFMNENKRFIWILANDGVRLASVLIVKYVANCYVMPDGKPALLFGDVAMEKNSVGVESEKIHLIGKVVFIVNFQNVARFKIAEYEIPVVAFVILIGQGISKNPGEHVFFLHFVGVFSTNHRAVLLYDPGGE